MDQHKHCKICEKPIPLDEDFCSKKCENEFEEIVKGRKKKQYIVYALFIIFLVVMALSLIFPG